MDASRTIRVVGVIVALVLGLEAGAQAEQKKRQPEPGPAAPPAASAPAGGTIGSLDLVSSEQIGATAAPDILAALALVPTLVLSDTGGPGGVGTLSLRGSTSAQVVVLLDGHRLAGTQSSFFNINDLPVPIERIERIEVVPAPVSVLYGTDAIGGVVNIITRPAGTTPGIRLGYGSGSDGESRLSGGVQYGIGKVGLSLDGQLRTGDGFRDNGDFDLKNLAAALSIAPAPWGLDLRWSMIEREAGVPGPASLPSPNAREKDSRDEVRLDFTYLPGGSWDVKAGGFSRQQSLRFDDADPPEPDPQSPAAPIASLRDNRSQGFEAQWDFATDRGERYTIGGEWVADAIEGDDNGKHDTERWGVFAQDQWHAGNWSAVGALRRDEHSVYGEQTSPSLSVAWGAAGWKLWGSWARGYRAPGLDELYGSEPFLQGNPDVVPETSESYEGGAEMGGAGGRVRLNTFWRDVSNLIFLADPDGDGVFRPENVAQAHVSGWEAEVLYRLSPTISAPIGYQSLSVVDANTDERLPGSVHSVWRAAIQSTGGSFTWSIEYAVTDRGDFQFRDGAWRYPILNAALAWRKKMGSFPVQISVRGENLQDRDYETLEGYPQRGSSWFAEVKVGL